MRRYLMLVPLLAGCAALPDDPSSNPEAAAPLVCMNKAQCDLYWQRAQAWVANSSTYYRISLATDTLIETYGPTPGRMDLAYRVTRIPQGDGAQILIVANCGNVFGCAPTRTDAIAGFKRYVRN